MLLRPSEVLVPRDHKAQCLQDRFNLLATAQVDGKEKLWNSAAAMHDRCGAPTACSCTSVHETSGYDRCPTEDSMQAARDWCVLCVLCLAAGSALQLQLRLSEAFSLCRMAQRKKRTVQRPTKLLQARNMATWLRKRELDDRMQQAPWVGGSKDLYRKVFSPHTSLAHKQTRHI